MLYFIKNKAVCFFKHAYSQQVYLYKSPYKAVPQMCSWLYKVVIEMQNTETMILRTVRWKKQFTEILYSISNRKIMLDGSLFYITEYMIRPINTRMLTSDLPQG